MSPSLQCNVGRRLLFSVSSNARYYYGPQKIKNAMPSYRFSTNNNNSNAPIQNNSSKNPSIKSLEQQLSTLQADLQKLTYLIHQSQSSTNSTQELARRAEARAYIIEQKLEDIQSHVVKIPAGIKAMENMAQNVGERVESRLRNILPQRMKDTFDDSKALLANKYTFWGLAVSGLLFYQYRTRMYQRTSEEVAEVAALTLQQDSLRQVRLSTTPHMKNLMRNLSIFFLNSSAYYLPRLFKKH